MEKNKSSHSKDSLLIKQLNQKEKELKLKEKELELKEQYLNQMAEKKQSLSEIYNIVKGAVYLIYTQKERGISQGSAFCLNNSGLSISNFHIFENASSVIAYNENKKEFLITEILDYSKENDFIIFRIGPNNGDLPFVRLAEKNGKIGDECFAVGNPKGLTQTLSKGIVSGYRDGQKYIQTTTEITHGSSGGPLFNILGKVIGVTTSGVGDANLNFAVNIKQIPISKYIEKEIKIQHSLKEEDVISFIKKYQNTLKREDFNGLEDMYSDQLGRFHSLYNIGKDVAIKDHRNYLKKYKILEFKIDPATVNILRNESVYFVNFKHKYMIMNRKSRRTLNYVLETIIEINTHGKIQSIYENILEKK